MVEIEASESVQSLVAKIEQALDIKLDGEYEMVVGSTVLDIGQTLEEQLPAPTVGVLELQIIYTDRDD